MIDHCNYAVTDLETAIADVNEETGLLLTNLPTDLVSLAIEIKDILNRLKGALMYRH